MSITINNASPRVTVSADGLSISISNLGIPGPAGTTNHSLLTNLSADDHPQYHNDARGDARYTPIAHASNTSNPHSVTKAQVGLGSVDNTADVDKPISTATQAALNGKEPTISAGTTSQYWRGDKTWQTLPDGVTDHGALTGLGDDDHAQYHNDARGDARYSQLGHTHSYEAAGAVAAHEAALDPHPQYMTEAEGDAAYADIAHVHDISQITATGFTNKHVVYFDSPSGQLKGRAMTDTSSTPLMNGVGSPGNSTTAAPWNHIHPSDTSKEDAGTAAAAIAAHEAALDPHPGVYDPFGSASTAQAYSVQRANHTGTQALSTLSQTGAIAGQVPTWTGAEWVPQTPTAGGSSQLVLVNNEAPSFTAPATSFTLANSDAINGSESVYLAGVKLTRGTDYTVGSWPTINLVGLTLNTGAALIVNYVRPPAASPVPSGFVFVSAKGDFPTPSGGIITLAANTTYFIVTHVDLLGDRLVGSANTTIIGGSSENCSLTSTGLTGQPLYETGYTCPVRNITFRNAEWGVSINQGANPNPVAVDWQGVNIQNCLIAGVVGTVENFIFTEGALLSSGPLSFSGTVGTIGFDGCLFSKTSGTATLLELTSSCVITRRFRIIYSSFVAVGTVTALSVSASATIPTESYILDSVNFSGGGTYISGVDHTSNKSLFKHCKNITNTSVNGQMYMNGNATATTISNTTDFFKIAGVTSASADNAKYDHSDNRLTNRATISRKYFIHADLSYTAGANQVIEVGFYDSKLAAVRTPSRTKSTANGAGRAENVSLSCVVNHSDGDYLELWVRNTTSAANVTVDHINFTITELGN